jgi:hypothetical protein
MNLKKTWIMLRARPEILVNHHITVMRKNK